MRWLKVIVVYKNDIEIDRDDFWGAGFNSLVYAGRHFRKMCEKYKCERPKNPGKQFSSLINPEGFQVKIIPL